MYTAKLARSGMKGRKRDTRILLIVLTLSFIFTTISTILISSMEYTDEFQKKQIYAEWQAALFNADEQTAEAVKASFDTVGVSRVIGQNQTFGIVGTMDEGFKELANLSLVEGRYPEAPGEVVIETNQIGSATGSLGVGDSLRSTFKLIDDDGPSDSFEYVEVPGAYDEVNKQMREKLDSGYYNDVIWEYAQQQGFEYGRDSYEYKVYYNDIISSYYKIQQDRSTDRKMYNKGNVVITVDTQYIYYSCELDYLLDPASYQRDIKEKGVVCGQNYEMNMSLTVVGIVETFSDRWDTGVQYMPVSFVTEETADQLLNAFNELMEEIPKSGGFNYVQNTNLFVKSDSTDALSTYNALKESMREIYQSREDSPELWMELDHIDSKAMIKKDLFDSEKYILKTSYYKDFNMLVPYILSDYEVDGVTFESMVFETEEYVNLDPGNDNGTYAIYLKRPSEIYENPDKVAPAPTTVEAINDNELWTVFEHAGQMYIMESRNFNEESYIRDCSYYDDPYLAIDYIYDYNADKFVTVLLTSEDYQKYIPKPLLQASGQFAATLNITLPPERFYPGKANESLKWLDEDPYENDMYELRLNRFANPKDAVKSTMSLAVQGIIFITTVCAVLQIFLTQIKRRRRRLAVMKCVGATNGQVGGMLTWEGIYLLMISLPLGAALGFGLSYGGMMLMGSIEGSRTLMFFVDWESLAIGFALGIASLFLGILVPMIMAIRTPLRGDLGSSGKKKPVKQRLKAGSTGARQTFASISRRHAQANRSRVTLSFALSTFIITIILITLFLDYRAFSDYNGKVVEANKPEYLVAAPYGLSAKGVESALEKLDEVDGLKSIYIYKVIEDVNTLHTALNENSGDVSPIIKKLAESIPDSMHHAFFSDGASRTLYVSGEEGMEEVTVDGPEQGSFITTAYGIDVDMPIYEQLTGSLTEGQLDKAAFQKGEEVILMVPMYKQGKGGGSVPDNLYKLPPPQQAGAALRSARDMALSLSNGTSRYYEADTSVKVGDTLTLYGKNVSIPMDFGTVTTEQTKAAVKVAGIIRYFPGEEIWPFSASDSLYTVIGSYGMITDINPDANNKLMTVNRSYMLSMNTLYFGNARGRTEFYISAEDGATRNNTDLPLLRMAKELNFVYENYRESNSALFSEAINNALIVGLLGFAAAMIALVILANTVSSAIDQERKRFGILQSIGVEEKTFKKQQYMTGLKHGLLSLAIANAVMLIVLFVFSLINNAWLDMGFMDYVKDMVFITMSRYPWAIHFALCGAYLIVSLLIHRIPVRNVLKYSAVENIRS